MKTTASTYDKGAETLRKLLGNEKAENVISRFRNLNPEFEKEVVSVVFGRTWSREAIDAKTRALFSIAILSTAGRVNALKIVFEIALSNGATMEEITEVLLQVGIYAGYPAALDAFQILSQMQTEHQK